MAGSSATSVAGLTAAAVATVGFLAFQASANVPASLRGPHHPGTTSAAAPKAHRTTGNATALPGLSGTGRRVVYSPAADRVWLVRTDGTVVRTFKVAPGTVDPPPGAYVVTSRSGRVTGTDGTPVEHVVRFTTVNGVTIGFSAAVGGPTQLPDPALRTGGIRESRPDGDAMWSFATIGERVVVVR